MVDRVTHPLEQNMLEPIAKGAAFMGQTISAWTASAI
jgi:hypothetical protein